MFAAGFDAPTSVVVVIAAVVPVAVVAAAVSTDYFGGWRIFAEAIGKTRNREILRGHDGSSEGMEEIEHGRNKNITDHIRNGENRAFVELFCVLG